MLLPKHIKDVVQGKASLGKKRSPKWPQVRKEHLKKFPYCAACGETNKLEVHHIKSFSEYPELELSPTNLITLCESKSFGITCHQFIGHLGNYKKINPDVIQDCIYAHFMLSRNNKSETTDA